MTENAEVDPEKVFNYDLERAGENTQTIFGKLLNSLRRQRTTKHGLGQVPLEDRKELLSRAKTIAQYGNADSEEMARNWDKHNQRAPIGGSQEDKD